MGFFDFLKPNKGKQRGLVYAPTMAGVNPTFTSFGDNVYASDIVVQSIRCKANEMKKLDPQHIRITGGRRQVVTDSSIAKVLRRPNPYMTQADFLEKITILRELTNNCFIYPTYYMTQGGERYYTGLYPLKPQRVDYMQDDGGKLYLHFVFYNGYEVTLPADSVIHWRKDYGVNDYFGGGAFGGNDNDGLLTMLERYDLLTQGIAQALKCSCQINGIAKLNTYATNDDQKQKEKEFQERILSNEGGILFTDNKIEYTQLPRDVKLVDAETLKFFYETILRANGTSLAILNGDYSKQQKEAYFEHALEGDIKSLRQAMAKVLFTDREASFGNDIGLYTSAINFMTMENRIAYMQVAVPAGALSVNQILELGGFPPIEGGDDIRPRGYNELDGTQQNDSTGADAPAENEG
jgi:HK97 family phage portal protein